MKKKHLINCNSVFIKTLLSREVRGELPILLKPTGRPQGKKIIAQNTGVHNAIRKHTTHYAILEAKVGPTGVPNKEATEHIHTQ